MIPRARDKVKYLFFIDIYARRTYHPSPRTPLAALYLFAFYYNLLEIIDTGTKNRLALRLIFASAFCKINALFVTVLNAVVLQ